MLPKGELIMKKPLDEKTVSLAREINTLAPINNSLYGASGELEPLIRLLVGAKTSSDSIRAAKAINILAQHLFQCATFLKTTSQTILTELKEIPLRDREIKH